MLGNVTCNNCFSVATCNPGGVIIDGGYEVLSRTYCVTTN